MASSSGFSYTTLHFFCFLVLNVALSIYVQRIGDRNNDAKASHAGRMKFLSTFFGFNHPIYREVEYSELRNKVLYPESVKLLRKSNTTFVKPKGQLPQKHQGGDFMLEQQINRLKIMAPKGKATEHTWQRLSRNLDATDKIVQNGMWVLNIDENDTYRFTGIENEIITWRAHLRYSPIPQGMQGIIYMESF